MLEIGRVDLALEYVLEGLSLDPTNQELLRRKEQITSRFQATPTQVPAPATNRFENKHLGLSFNVPQEVSIYTADNPGPMAARITYETPIWLVSSNRPNERINVKFGADITMADLKNMMSESAYLTVPNYERISFKEITIGKDSDKPAYEHVHLLKTNPTKKIRQIAFAHGGNAFVFTCATSVDRYEATNQEFFEMIFRSVDFK